MKAKRRFIFIYSLTVLLVSEGICEEKIRLDMQKIPETKIEMLKTEVPQALYESVMGVNPSCFKGKNNPVDCVSWYDAIYFCNKLSILNNLTPVYAVNGETDISKWNYEPNNKDEQFHKLEGIVTQDINADGYRLPTENEWTIAANGGNNYKYAGSNDINEVAWYEGNSGKTTHPVAQKKPNGYNLYDMSGNVSEWIWWGLEYTNSTGCFRGGAWDDYDYNCVIDNNGCGIPRRQYSDFGFRFVCNAK